jgi:hypothetical protein
LPTFGLRAGIGRLGSGFHPAAGSAFPHSAQKDAALSAMDAPQYGQNFIITHLAWFLDSSLGKPVIVKRKYG